MCHGCVTDDTCTTTTTTTRYGVVLKDLGKTAQAKAVLMEAVDKAPLNWSAWLELSNLCASRDDVR